MATHLSCRIPLPRSYRSQDILAFHRRDAQEISERVDESSLRKGLLWQSVPACLSLSFQPRQAVVELALDGAAPAGSQDLLDTTVTRDRKSTRLNSSH